MKILFLDFDGVLNHRGWFENKRARAEEDDRREFCPRSIEALNTITAAGAKVVISSSWRLMHELPYLKRLLRDEGVNAEVIGKTPNLWNSTSDGGTIVTAEPRGHEILAWIEGANADAKRRGASGTPVEGVVILDDDTDMACMAPWHVKTEFDEGLRSSHVAKALELLNQPFTLPDHG